MNIHLFPRTLSRQIARFGRDQQGASAVELAMILPILLTFYLGTVEVSQGIGIDRKVTLTTRTAADLASQVSSINNADMANLLAASSAVIAPYDPAPLKVTVSLVTIDANGNAKVTWSDTLNGTKRAVGSSVALPTALKMANTSLVWSEVSYSYKPTVSYVITGMLNLSDEIYMRPRLSELDHPGEFLTNFRGLLAAAEAIGSAVADVIFSISKRGVTLVSGTATIIFFTRA